MTARRAATVLVVVLALAACGRGSPCKRAGGLMRECGWEVLPGAALVVRQACDGGSVRARVLAQCLVDLYGRHGCAPAAYSACSSEAAGVHD